MQSFGTLLSDNKGITVVVGLVAAIAVAAILIFLYRTIFGRRLHMTGGRSRQPRLGVVDAFDLDRQRQLVLVRRDNVEHLLMIGGPNDVVIESAFIRVQPSIAVPAGRDKEASAALAPVVPMPLAPTPPESGLGPIDTRPVPGPGKATAAPLDAGRTAQPPLDLIEPVPPKDPGPLADLPAPGPVTAPPPPAPPQPLPPPASPAKETDAGSGASPAAGPPAAAPRPFTSRLSTPLPPRSPAGTLPPRPPLTSPRLGATGGTATPATPRPSLLPNRPMPLTPLQRGTSAASLRREPSTPPAAAAPGEAPATDAPREPAAGPAPVAVPPLPPSPAASTETPAPPIVEPPPPAAPSLPVPVATTPPPAEPTSPPPLPMSIETLESLEEEMAKLLGRGGPPEKK